MAFELPSMVGSVCKWQLVAFEMPAEDSCSVLLHSWPLNCQQVWPLNCQQLDWVPILLLSVSSSWCLLVLLLQVSNSISVWQVQWQGKGGGPHANGEGRRIGQKAVLERSGSVEFLVGRGIVPREIAHQTEPGRSAKAQGGGGGGSTAFCCLQVSWSYGWDLLPTLSGGGVRLPLGSPSCLVIGRSVS